MTDTAGGSLNAAYEAIKAKDLAKARDVLSAYLLDNPNDADAWWLYSYAVADPEDGRKALQTVLRLDPAYPGARDLLDELENASPAAPAAVPAPPPGIKPVSSSAKAAAAAPLTTTVNPEDDLDPEFGFADEDKPRSGGISRVLIAAIAAIAVLAIVFAVLILPNLNRDESGSPTTDPNQTAVAAGATDVPTEEAAVATDEPTQDADASATDVPTEEAATEDASSAAPTADASAAEPTEEASTDPVPTDDPTGDTTNPEESFQPVYDALSTFTLVPDSVTSESTDLGQTVSVEVCAVSAELRTVIPGVLTALAAISPQLPADAEAVGARIVNCTTNEPLRFVAISIEDAQAYASGSITDADLRQRFTPLP